MGVLLLAGLILAGGTIAVFMAPRNAVPTNESAVLPGLPTSRLEIFEQETPTPSPQPPATPWFPSATPYGGLLSVSPSLGLTFAPPTAFPTPRPTRPPPTPTPDTKPRAKFGWSQLGTSAQFNENSTGGVVSWFWEFEGGATSGDQNPSYDFGSYGSKSVKLTVTDADGDTDSMMRTIDLVAPDCDENGQPPGCNPTPPPTEPPPPTPSPAGSPATES